MVGLPYSSAGCVNCRKRKIKCDSQKPVCAKCLKRGILCLGFDKDRKFLHHEMRSQVTRSGEVKRPVRRLVWYLKPLSLPSFCDMSGEVRTQLFSAFMDNFFAPNANINGKDDSLFFLMANFPTLAGESELLDRSVIALAFSFLAIKSNDKNLARQGLEVYNSALNAMNRALRRKSGSWPHMLYASIIFHTYETLYYGDDAPRSLFTHIQGASAILKSYSFSDTNSLTLAMLKRHKWAVAYCTLNTEYGLETDWECLTLGKEECPLDELFKIIGYCAALRRDLVSASRLNSPEQEPTLQSILQRLLDIQRVQAGWERLHSDSLSPHRRGQAMLDSESSGEDVGLDPYEFKDLCTAKLYVLSRIASTVRHRLIYQTEKLLHGYSDPTSMHFSADEICRSVVYCMRPERQMSVGHMALFAVSQASKAYITCRDLRMFEWCQCIYSTIQARGIGLASRVGKEDWTLWRTAAN
ncbi:Zn(II)2Cys6 transcription factor domain-containing protein [Aspergillus puulaauensis]|uniref:Zn(2)-C6 fungal-type domain-containing protein n=1 Tax=Aspergillus puulaauensis TaxID=1220207 RepID=A0A7R7XI36_9EURO|nr:uncharacterized protein APUU_30085S [Aspergillus puulaauensis]BCS21860.1 hypothetical protein APUU_30085S [Aspergillus puulaauensis]